jgi:hypothetical protein
MLDVVGQMVWEWTPLEQSLNGPLPLEKVEYSIVIFDLREVDIITNFAIYQQGRLEDLGRSEQLPPLPHGMTLIFMDWPVCRSSSPLDQT